MRFELFELVQQLQQLRLIMDEADSTSARS